MIVGWVGLGKLGLPCAAVLSQHHSVYGYDVEPERVQERIDHPPAWEQGLADLLRQTGWGSMMVTGDPAMLERADIILVAVPTPHAKHLDGTQPWDDDAEDFDYRDLIAALETVARNVQPGVPVCVVSTVSPGAAARHGFAKLVPDNPYVYHPAFIAMGTTIADYRRPEFRLVGCDGPEIPPDLLQMYHPIDYPMNRASDHQPPPMQHLGVAEAETVKMLYNTWIGLKIGFANTVAQIADGVGADADVVMGTLAAATDRVNSWAYMRSGMGDGGACHPRDQLAMAALAEEYLTEPWDLFRATIMAREQHARWLIGLLHEARRFVVDATVADHGPTPLVILGYAYKPDTALDYGSHALLVANLLRAKGWDPQLIDATMGDDEAQLADLPAAYLIGCAHSRYRQMVFAPGSVVLDPFGIIDTHLNRHVVIVTPGRRAAYPQWPTTGG